MRWLGTSTSVIGAFILAVGFMLWGYILFTIGSAAWLLVGIKEKDNALISLNVAFLAADALGLYNVIFSLHNVVK